MDSPDVRAKITAESLSTELKAMPGWTLLDDKIQKTFTFAEYSEAASFVQFVAHAAMEADHHPDIFLTYGKVVIETSTHDRGGVTGMDIALAKTIDRLFVPDEEPSK